MTNVHLQPALPRADGMSSAAMCAFVHPCVIAGERCLVHERGLEQREPAVYLQLVQLAREQGFRLQEDRRRQNLRVSRNRRSRWAIVLVLMLSSMLDGSVMASQGDSASLAVSSHQPWRADESNGVTQSYSPEAWSPLSGQGMPNVAQVGCDTAASRAEALFGKVQRGGGDASADRSPQVKDGSVVTRRSDPRECPRSSPARVQHTPGRAHVRAAVLGLIPVYSQRPDQSGGFGAWNEASGPSGTDVGAMSVPREAQPGAFEKMRELLYSHYQAKPDDPDYIGNDLDRIAAYYSRFPEVLRLMSNLEGKPWRLRYGKDTWVTKASGTRVSVNQATVVFDPRMAAKLRFHKACAGGRRCTAAPADALLHELLHVHTMFSDTKRFIAQGGMGSSLYPYAHEAEVISAENALYSSMTELDGLPRPQRSRHKHTGKLVKASCVLCIN